MMRAACACTSTPASSTPPSSTPSKIKAHARPGRPPAWPRRCALLDRAAPGACATRERGRIDLELRRRVRARASTALSPEKTKAPAAMAAASAWCAARSPTRSATRSGAPRAGGGARRPRSTLRAGRSRPTTSAPTRSIASSTIATRWWRPPRVWPTHPALDADDRLRYARAAVRAMVRGLPYDEAAGAAGARAAGAAPDSELAFALELQRAVLAIRDEDPPRERARRAGRALQAADAPRTPPRASCSTPCSAPPSSTPRSWSRRWPSSTSTTCRAARGERRRAERLYERAMLGARLPPPGARATLPQAREAFDDGGAPDRLARGARRLRRAAPARRRDRRRSSSAEYASASGATEGRAPRSCAPTCIARELPSLHGERTPRRSDRAARPSCARLGGAARPGGRRGAVRRAAARALPRGRDARGGAEGQRALPPARSSWSARNPRYRRACSSSWRSCSRRWATTASRSATSRSATSCRSPTTPPAWQQRLTQARIALPPRSRRRGRQGRRRGARAGRAHAGAGADFARWRSIAPRSTTWPRGKFERALALYDAELPLRRTGDDRNRLVARLARAAAALGAGQARRAARRSRRASTAAGRSAPRALVWPHTTPATRRCAAIASSPPACAPTPSCALGELDAAAARARAAPALAAERFAAPARRAPARRWRWSRRAWPTWRASATTSPPPTAGSAWRSATPTTTQATGRAAARRPARPLALRRRPAPRRQLQLTVDLPRRLDHVVARLAKVHDPVFRIQQRWFEVDAALLAPR